MRLPVHLVRTQDGVCLAWTRTGSGPALVKAANWMTHLRDDVDSPVWRHWVRFFTDHYSTLLAPGAGPGAAVRRSAHANGPAGVRRRAAVVHLPGDALERFAAHQTDAALKILAHVALDVPADFPVLRLRKAA